MRSLNAESYFVHYLGLKLCFQLQIHDPVVLKSTKKCVCENGMLQTFYAVSDAIINIYA